MKSLILIISVILALFSFLNGLNAFRPLDQVSTTIVVDQNGKGQFTTVQQAVDSIPPNNPWTLIHLNSGVYNCILSIGTLCANITIFSEKVEIKKPYIILEGDRDQQTVIQYGDGGNVVTSPTFKLNADNFVARYIVFKNTYDNLPSKLDASGVNTTWAPAAAINGDRASFYHCSFSSLQDTLTDAKGRHYFYDCKISGAIDFIWGNAQSIYENCQINSLASKIAPRVGFITAQARESPEENTGFVFKNCHVTGSGPMYLGRAHTNHARVLFAGTTMDNVIRAEGWDGARFKGSENLISFSEANCRGPGANMSKRVKWEKKLSDQEVNDLTSLSYINQDGWIEKQPR
ncbi:putative pectinesterase [Rosa chinensis]|uniref:pectinesterase n=1 Tax=Rosa chinensis TaxID=74649 RepID=A0A2P6R7M4_ROSCH|nr:putative pectinesterase [Rosa chinensis]